MTHQIMHIYKWILVRLSLHNSSFLYALLNVVSVYKCAYYCTVDNEDVFCYDWGGGMEGDRTPRIIVNVNKPVNRVGSKYVFAFVFEYRNVVYLYLNWK